MNVVHLIGNVGQDPELRYTPGGQAVLNFSVATNETRKNKNTGEKTTETTWFSCTIWGERAEGLAPYINKGDKIGIMGAIKGEAYIDRAGQARTDLKVNVREVELIGRVNTEEVNTADRTPQADDDDVSDIPF